MSTTLIECVICGRDTQNAGRGMCGKHYHRFRKHGDPNYDARDPQRRFWAKVNKAAPNGCWEWTGALANTGYGIFNLGGGKLDNAHRTAYRWIVGPIPTGMHLDHLCRNRACCNPDHLEPVTPRENYHRATKIGHDHFNAPKTCKRGHDWSIVPPYLAHRADGSVSRMCRQCTTDSQRAAREAQQDDICRRGLALIEAAASCHDTLTIETVRAAFGDAGIPARRNRGIWSIAESRGIVERIPGRTARSIHWKDIAVYRPGNRVVFADLAESGS